MGLVALLSGERDGVIFKEGRKLLSKELHPRVLQVYY
jgi:hypothetical protein